MDDAGLDGPGDRPARPLARAASIGEGAKGSVLRCRRNSPFPMVIRLETTIPNDVEGTGDHKLFCSRLSSTSQIITRSHGYMAIIISKHLHTRKAMARMCDAYRKMH